MITKEDFKNLFNKIKDSIISLYSRIKTCVIKCSRTSRKANNNKQIKSISNKKNRSDDNLDVVSVKIKKVTVKKKDKNEN